MITFFLFFSQVNRILDSGKKTAIVKAGGMQYTKKRHKKKPLCVENMQNETI